MCDEARPDRRQHRQAAGAAKAVAGLVFFLYTQHLVGFQIGKVHLRARQPKPPLPFPFEFLRTLLTNLVHMNDNDAAPLNVRTDGAPQLRLLEVDRHHSPLTF